jgi:hypothetical protein
MWGATYHPLLPLLGPTYDLPPIAYRQDNSIAWEGSGSE